MRFAILAACGGKSTPPPQKAVDLAGPPSPAEPPKPPAPDDTRTKPRPQSRERAAFYDKLRDDGPLLGVTAYTQKREPSDRHCSGERVSVGKGTSTLSADEEAVAAMYRIEFPTGLDFSPDPRHESRRDASLKKFQQWLAATTKIAADGRSALQAKLTGAATVEEKSDYAVRIGQISLRMASLLARAEIPKDLRTGEFADEKIDAFCGEMIKIAEPMVARAAEAFSHCGPIPAGQKPWWAPLCTAP